MIPPLTPRRAPSPCMSPGTRRGRQYGSAEESRLRDLSPETTFHAFTQRPMPFDTTREEYKIFSCIEALTPAERDLGARVAKAAQRLKTWCAEIEQWGWSGSFEQPSKEERERRRRSIELRIREHVTDEHSVDTLPPLEYWGSLLSVEVEQHEARLDDIEEDLLKLDIEELKEHVLDMHPLGRSRPSSAGVEATRQNFRLMDDFSFLITQTLLSALPQHAQLKERLNTWTARVTILREAPRFANDLKTAQNAMRLGWEAIEPPNDLSDTGFSQWKEAVDTISSVLQRKVADLGRRLDRMLDTLEGREDCLPDAWIDNFEETEAEFGRWTQDSRRSIIEFDVRRRGGEGLGPIKLMSSYSKKNTPSNSQQLTHAQNATNAVGQGHHSAVATSASATEVAAIMSEKPINTPRRIDLTYKGMADASSPVTPSRKAFPDIFVRSTPDSSKCDHTTNDMIETPQSYASTSGSVIHKSPALPYDSPHLVDSDSTDFRSEIPKRSHAPHVEPIFNDASASEVTSLASITLNPVASISPEQAGVGDRADPFEEESDFEEGDTVIHHEVERDTDFAFSASGTVEPVIMAQDADATTKSLVLPDSPMIIASHGQRSIILQPPQTPRSRRGSRGSNSSELSFNSSPPGNIDESPSLRHNIIHAGDAPRPDLNPAMAKRRTAKIPAADPVPWPPTSFTQTSSNSAEDLERKISDILTTIPAHIRLTSGPSPDSPEVKPRGLAAKGSRGFLRAGRSVSGLKSPELTLSPAKNEFEPSNMLSGRRSAANLRVDDIKLYHLTQPGKEQPVKLFIRRVGENGERVMVRVGGGWADLGEYLRQYAEHHGRRTASEGKFEILGLEVNNQNESPNRPDSAVGRHNRRISGNFTPGSPTTTPVKSSGRTMTIDEDRQLASTPDEAGIPSTSSSQRSWRGNEVGLAGPNARKLDLSEEKREWIEGMMKQARTVSGHVVSASHGPFQREDYSDSRSNSRSDSRTSLRGSGMKQEFGDLGKVGGTKRIFMKGGKPHLADG